MKDAYVRTVTEQFRYKKSKIEDLIVIYNDDQFLVKLLNTELSRVNALIEYHDRKDKSV